MNATACRRQVGAGVWTFFTRTGVVRPSRGVTRAEGPAHTSLGQNPRSRAPKNNLKRQRRGPISKIVERKLFDPPLASKYYKSAQR